jgi:hypothetical protein
MVIFDKGVDLAGEQINPPNRLTVPWRLYS